jgi:transposase
MASERASHLGVPWLMLRKVKLCLRHPALRRYLVLKIGVVIDRRPYATDMSDARWALLVPVLSAWRAGRAAAGLGLAAPAHDLREIVNAILYVNRAGCAWHLLPHDFPPYQTVYGYYAAWEKDGTTAAIHDLLRGKVRERAGRAAEPTAAILDAQSVKTSCNPPEATQGVDNAKKIKGRKRHIATGTLGLLLAVPVTAASVQDNPGGQALIRALAAGHLDVARVWVDAGYKRAVADEGAAHGIDVQVYSKPAGLKGSTPRRGGRSSAPSGGSCCTAVLPGITRPSRNAPFP